MCITMEWGLDDQVFRWKEGRFVKMTSCEVLFLMGFHPNKMVKQICLKVERSPSTDPYLTPATYLKTKTAQIRIKRCIKFEGFELELT